MTLTRLYYYLAIFSLVAGDSDHVYSSDFSIELDFSGDYSIYSVVFETDSPTLIPSYVPSMSPSYNPSAVPTHNPSYIPSAVPTLNPTVIPSCLPTQLPTCVPSSMPSSTPTSIPSVYPSDLPSQNPSVSPSVQPTIVPSEAPTNVPSEQPSDIPTTATPTYQPSVVPSTGPTVAPFKIGDTVSPTLQPSKSPTLEPSSKPTSDPTISPSKSPSASPSSVPSKAPTLTPTRVPTDEPTVAPTATTTIVLECSQVCTGISADEFNSDPINAQLFAETVSEGVGVSSGDVEVGEVTDEGTRLRQRARRLATSAATVPYSIRLLIQTLGFQDADTAASFVSDSLSEFVSSGNFTTSLKAKAVSASVSTFASMEGSVVDVSSYSVEYNSKAPSAYPTSFPSQHHAGGDDRQDDDGVTDDEPDSGSGAGGGSGVVVIVVTVVGCVLLVGGGLFAYWYINVHQKSFSSTSRSVTPSAKTAAVAFDRGHHVRPAETTSGDASTNVVTSRNVVFL